MRGLRCFTVPTSAAKVRRLRVAVVCWWVAWPFIHVGDLVLPETFFRQVLLALSVYAVVCTKQTELAAARVKVDVEGATPGSSPGDPGGSSSGTPSLSSPRRWRTTGAAR